MQYKLEICANSIESALAAQKGGADRIELCDNMAEGGTTPSNGMIKRCKTLLQIPVFPIIRPRGGGFVYTEEEFEVMKEDILNCKALKCEGVVFGILDHEGNIDLKRCAELIALARPMEVTFHRAFDCCADMEKGLEDIISLGCDRLLTSGGAATAFDGLTKIQKLVQQAGERLIIMPGAGITDDNLSVLVKGTGASEFHSTAKVLIRERGNACSNSIMESSIFQSDPHKVSLMKRILINVL